MGSGAVKYLVGYCACSIEDSGKQLKAMPDRTFHKLRAQNISVDRLARLDF